MGALALGAAAALAVVVVGGAAGAAGETSAATATLGALDHRHRLGGGALRAEPRRVLVRRDDAGEDRLRGAQREQHRDAEGDRRDQEGRCRGEGRPDLERVAVAALLLERGGHRRLHGLQHRQRDDPKRVALGRRHRRSRGRGSEPGLRPVVHALRRDRALPPRAVCGRRERARQGADARGCGQGAAGRPALDRRVLGRPGAARREGRRSGRRRRRSSRGRSASRLSVTVEFAIR